MNNLTRLIFVHFKSNKHIMESKIIEKKSSGKSVKFQSNDGHIFELELHRLQMYPNSFFSLQSKGIFLGDFDKVTGVIHVNFNSNTMKHISYFYKNGSWKMPYLLENRWEIEGCSDFSECCQFLGLPDYIEDDDEEDEEYDPLLDGLGGYTDKELSQLKKEMEQQEKREFEEFLKVSKDYSSNNLEYD